MECAPKPPGAAYCCPHAAVAERHRRQSKSDVATARRMDEKTLAEEIREFWYRSGIVVSSSQPRLRPLRANDLLMSLRKLRLNIGR